MHAQEGYSWYGGHARGKSFGVPIFQRADGLLYIKRNISQGFLDPYSSMHKISQEYSDLQKIGGMCKVTMEICNILSVPVKFSHTNISLEL